MTWNRRMLASDFSSHVSEFPFYESIFICFVSYCLSPLHPQPWETVWKLMSAPRGADATLWGFLLSWSKSCPHSTVLGWPLCRVYCLQGRSLLWFLFFRHQFVLVNFSSSSFLSRSQLDREGTRVEEKRERRTELRAQTKVSCRKNIKSKRGYCYGPGTVPSTFYT